MKIPFLEQQLLQKEENIVQVKKQTDENKKNYEMTQGTAIKYIISSILPNSYKKNRRLISVCTVCYRR